jgi:hypothetical protein
LVAFVQFWVFNQVSPTVTESCRCLCAFSCAAFRAITSIPPDAQTDSTEVAGAALEMAATYAGSSWAPTA